MKNNKTFLITFAALVLTFGGIVACSETQEVEDTSDDNPVLVEPEVVEEDVYVEEDEQLKDLDQKIEDPELQDPNAKFDENLEESID